MIFTNRNNSGKRSGWLSGLLFLMLVVISCPAAVAQAATPYTIYVPEQLSGTTTISLPFKNAYNIKTFVFETSADVKISAAAGDKFGMTFENNNKRAKGTFSDESVNQDKIVFDLLSQDDSPLKEGTYEFKIVMLSKDECQSIEVPFNVQVAGKPVLELMDPTTICQGLANNLSVTAKSFTPSGIANVVLKYTWTAVLKSGTGVTFNAGAAGTEINYTSGNTLVTDNVTNTGTAPAVITYTVTPIAEYTFNGKVIVSTGETKVVDVTINPAIDIIVNPLSQTVGCGTSTNIALTSANTGGVNTWSWIVKDKGADISGADAGTGEMIAQALANAGNQEQTATYTVTHTFTNNGVVCQSVTQDVLVTVLPTVDLTVGTTGNVVCQGGTTSVELSSANTGTGVHSYIWSLNGTLPAGVTIAPGNGVNFTDLIYTGAVSNGKTVLAMILNNSGVTPADITFDVIHTYTLNGVACQVIKQVVLTVNPTLDVVAEGQTICSGSTTSVQMGTSNTGGSSKFSWNLNGTLPADVVLGTPAGVSVKDGIYTNSDNRTLAMTLTNSGKDAKTVIFTVTHEYTNGGVACSVTKNVEVIVNPAVDIQLAAGDPVCSETEKTVEFTTAGSVENMTYSWSFTFNPDEFSVSGDHVTVEGTKASGTGNFKVTLKNKKNEQKTITVEVKAVYNGTACGDTKVFSVTVNPKPVFELGE